MKKAIQIIKQHENYDVGYALKNSFQAGYLVAKYELQINDFYEKYPDQYLQVNSDGIQISGATRETLMDFLQIFGGNWKKEINTWQKDKMDYVQELSFEEGFDYTLKAVAVEPPPACQIVEEEVEVPAHKEIRKRIVCPEPLEKEGAVV